MLNNSLPNLDLFPLHIDLSNYNTLHSEQIDEIEITLPKNLKRYYGTQPNKITIHLNNLQGGVLLRPTHGSIKEYFYKVKYFKQQGKCRQLLRSEFWVIPYFPTRCNNTDSVFKQQNTYVLPDLFNYNLYNYHNNYISQRGADFTISDGNRTAPPLNIIEQEKIKVNIIYPKIDLKPNFQIIAIEKVEAFFNGNTIDLDHWNYHNYQLNLTKTPNLVSLQQQEKVELNISYYKPLTLRNIFIIEQN